jgi:hypothetical protein
LLGKCATSEAHPQSLPSPIFHPSRSHHLMMETVQISNQAAVAGFERTLKKKKVLTFNGYIVTTQHHHCCSSGLRLPSFSTHLLAT